MILIFQKKNGWTISRQRRPWSDAMSDLGLHCLSITLLGVSRLQWVNIVLFSLLKKDPLGSIFFPFMIGLLSTPFQKGICVQRSDFYRKSSSKLSTFYRKSENLPSVFPLTLVMLNKLRCHTHFKFSANQIIWSRLLILIHILNDKCCRSRSVGFWRNQMIWIYTVCKGKTYAGTAELGLRIIQMLNKVSKKVFKYFHWVNKNN